MSGRAAPALSPLELEVMNVIWKLGECTSAEVIREFRKRRKLADTTIRTVLANIRKKGYLGVAPSVEPRIRFRPGVSRRAVARRMLKQLVENLFGDSPREAIKLLLEDEKIDRAELDEIHRLIHRRADGQDES